MSQFTQHRFQPQINITSADYIYSATTRSLGNSFRIFHTTILRKTNYNSITKASFVKTELNYWFFTLFPYAIFQLCPINKYQLIEAGDDLGKASSEALILWSSTCVYKLWKCWGSIYGVHATIPAAFFYMEDSRFWSVFKMFQVFWIMKQWKLLQLLTFRETFLCHFSE
jgi:hypothetical protein